MMAPALAALAIASLLSELSDEQDLTPPVAQGNAEIARSIAVRASVARKEFALLEPIEVEFEGVNVGDVHLLTGSTKSIHNNSILVVYDSKGELMPKTRYGEALRRMGGTRMGAPGGLMPGATLKGTLVANLMYDMSMPGEYRIVLGIPITNMTVGKKAVGYAEAVSVRVVESEPERMAPVAPVGVSDHNHAEDGAPERPARPAWK